MPHSFRRGARLLLPVMCATLALAACGDQPVESLRQPAAAAPSHTLQAFKCVASRSAVSCSPESSLNGRGTVIGNQNTNIKLTSSNVSYDAGTEIFSFDVTVQNLLNESIGTPDGTTAATNGIRVFFNSGPTVTQGSGEVTVANADGVDAFTGSNQPFFRYSEILDKDEVSQPHTWQLTVPASATQFTFTLFVDTDVQYKLVINEVMANPANYNSNPDVTGEWFEVYNAGSLKVDMQNLVIADSAPAGRQPYHKIGTSLVVQPGAYVVLGRNTDTANNGGVPVDYAYGPTLALANSFDAVKVARVVGTDTLTLDRTQYASAATSAADGIARELKNPALDNSNMDGSNWASALVTAVYGPGGRGTPKAQNSTYTP